MDGDAVEEDELGGAGDEDALEWWLELSQRLFEELVEEPFEGDPAAHAGVVDGVSEGGVAGIEVVGLERGEVEVGPAFGVFGEFPCRGFAGGELALRGGGLNGNGVGVLTLVHRRV